MTTVVAGPTVAHDPGLIERLCEAQHDAYEAAAAASGWETQKASRVPWAQVPEANKATMRASVTAVLDVLAGEGRLCQPGELLDLRARLDASVAARVAATWVGDGMEQAMDRLRAEREADRG